jgi:hypothetical protein
MNAPSSLRGLSNALSIPRFLWYDRSKILIISQEVLSDDRKKSGDHGQIEQPTPKFLSQLSNPARSALEYHGITSLKLLSQYSEKEILKLHGIGPASLPILRAALQEEGLSFRS